MLEAPQDNRHRDAFRAAHAARGDMVAKLWKAVFARRS
jgi:hypothetical protein